VTFALGQPAIQLVSIATGFLLLRWMPVEHYAQFGVAFAFQSTVAMLADLGFSSSILALAGTRATDPEVIGRYLRSARHFRRILVGVVGLVFAVAFPLITAGQPWGFAAKAWILASILTAVVVQGWSMYQAPLLAHRMIGHLYQPQIAVGFIRLGLSALLHLAHVLTGVGASWLSTLALAVNGGWMRYSARRLVSEPPRPDPVANREMLRYLAPLMPGVVFSAFQSQIQIAIIIYFGTTQNIAEVTALGRLGQIFGILVAFNSVIVGPYIAALPATRLRGRYIIILFGSFLVAGCLSVIAFALPSPLLWLIGPRYANLGPEVGWVVLASSVSYVGGVMWTMHASRKWVFWWGTVLYITLLLAAQIGGAVWLDLSSTRGVVLFGVVTAFATLGVHIFTALYGFLFRQPNPYL
jgi:O-antigen/teichoic acid export membrane protein